MSSRVWVITGTSTGLGLATALYALKQGDKVIATVRSLSKFPEELKKAGAYPLVLDLEASDEAIKQAAEDALQVYGYVDVLVNNAGTNAFGYGPVEEISMQDIRKQFQINLFSLLAFTQPFITHFRTRRTGTIFNFSSVCSLPSPPCWAAYSGSKVAIDTFSDALASELALFNVRVYDVLPGCFFTHIWEANKAYAADLNNRGDAAGRGSKVYTDPDTQGFDSINTLPRLSAATGLFGDPDKLAMRLYEIVAGVGLAAEVMGMREGRPAWNRVPLGTDSGSIILSKLEDIAENVRAYEPLWRSVDDPSSPTVG